MAKAIQRINLNTIPHAEGAQYNDEYVDINAFKGCSGSAIYNSTTNVIDVTLDGFVKNTAMATTAQKFLVSASSDIAIAANTGLRVTSYDRQMIVGTGQYNSVPHNNLVQSETKLVAGFQYVFVLDCVENQWTWYAESGIQRQILSGEGEPDASLGIDGDIYIQYEN